MSAVRCTVVHRRKLESDNAVMCLAAVGSLGQSLRRISLGPRQRPAARPCCGISEGVAEGLLLCRDVELGSWRSGRWPAQACAPARAAALLSDHTMAKTTIRTAQTARPARK